MNWLRNAFRLFLSLAATALLFIVLAVIWITVGDGKMALIGIVTICVRFAGDVWELLGLLNPWMAGEDDDEKDEP